MKVKELIEKLKEFDEDLEVLIENEDCDYGKTYNECELYKIGIEKIRKSKHFDSYVLELAKEDSTDGYDALVIKYDEYNMVKILNESQRIN